MILSFQINRRIYLFDAAKPLSLAIPLRFNDRQPNAYGVAPASSRPCEAGALVGDTRRGGSCNFEEYRLIPHCNGTHTESVGHLTHERIAVNDCLKDALLPAVLISVEPETAGASRDTYAAVRDESDPLLTRRALEKALDGLEIPLADFASETFAFVVRTLPNEADKLARAYLDEIPPYFSSEAMELIDTLGVAHLLVDTPSIDRLFDEGKLANHRRFWRVAPGTFALAAESRPHRTVTELIYAPDEIADGLYLLNLQIAPFATDASPSRPLLFPLRKDI